MDQKKIEKLLELIDDLVHEGSPWQDKRDSVLNEASDTQKTSLEEFASWYAASS